MPRKINVVTTCMNGNLGPTVRDNTDRVMELLDLACARKPDIVCLPENFATAGTTLSVKEKAEPVPGPTVDACAKRAREHRTYVICPLLTSQDGNFFNSAVVLDRSGDVVGIYNKMHPVCSRWDFTVLEHGVTPGRDAAVFELDCGKIGIQICFDILFPETWQQLGDGGAELVFWPSAYDGGFPLLAYAYQNSYYVVSAVRTSHARMINPLGEVLEHCGRRMNIVSRVIDLDFIVCHSDYHWGIPKQIISKYGQDVYVRMLQEEGGFLLESNSDALPLARIIEEFGMAPRRDYYRRHLALYETLEEGFRPEPQSPPYAGREPYTEMPLEELAL